MFRQVQVHDVPRLSVAYEDVHRGLEPARVIQISDQQADHVALGIFANRESRTAFAAETAQVVTPAHSCCRKVLQHAFGELERIQWHNHYRRVRPAADLLAIAAMTVEHH